MFEKNSLVTAVILTKNEAGNLARCFESLRWCFEIVVIDSGSNDSTVDTARKLGARVIVHVPSGRFVMAEQRNWALDNAGVQTPWVLFLDADEVVPPALAERIIEECGRDVPVADGFELTPRYLFWGVWLKRTQGFPNWHARLVRVGHARIAGGVWDHFASGVRVERIEEPYDHFANSKGFSDWLERHDRYSSWDAERIVEFLETGRRAALGTERKKRLRFWAARFWPLRPFVRFFQMYFLRLGFIEGKAAFVFSLLYFFYEMMTVVKVIEMRRRRKGLPL